MIYQSLLTLTFKVGHPTLASWLLKHSTFAEHILIIFLYIPMKYVLSTLDY